MRKFNPEKAKMYSLIDEFDASGLPLRTFARQRGLDYSKLDYWNRRKKGKKGSFHERSNNEKGRAVEKADAPSFIELEPFSPEREEVKSPSHVVLTFASGLRLEIFG